MGRVAAAAQGAPSSSPAQPGIGLRVYVVLWLVLVLVLTRDYLVLNHVISGGTVLRTLQLKGLLLRSGQKLTPVPGDPLSYRLGWLGFSIMLLTNLYILRKRLLALKDKGAIGGWLDFHIFCGLVGPTLIVFHTNLHVSGLVAVSFWSMMISFASGVVGRYLYTQLLRERGDLKAALAHYEIGFGEVKRVAKATLTTKEWKMMLDYAFNFAGGSEAMASGQATALQVFVDSLIGDFRLMFGHLHVPRGSPSNLRSILKGYGITRRRLVASTYFRQMMGYWHTFHMPFAVFMYVVAVIHIVAELVFRVRH